MAKGSALTKKMNVSEDLQEIVKVSTISRGDMMKKVWAYIKKNELQSAKDGRIIVPDEKLALVLGKKPINMLKMTGVLSKHLS